MTSAEAGRPRSRWGWRALWIFGAAGVGLLIVSAGLYVSRERISESLARDWLRTHGVSADLKISAISLTGLSAQMSLGNPADPDLTVERLEVGYGLKGPWSGAPFSVQTRSIHLVRPRIKLRLIGSRLDFGGLQRLIIDLSQGPPGAGPQPDIVVDDGGVRLLTAVGEVDARGDVALKSGGVTNVKTTVAPFRLVGAQGRIDSQGGRLIVDRHGGNFVVATTLGALTASHAGDRLDLAGLTLSGDVPALPKDGRWMGKTDLTLSAKVVSTVVSGVNTSGGALAAHVRGAVNGTADQQTMRGDAEMSLRLASLAGAGVSLRGASAGLQLAHLAIDRKGTVISLLGGGQAELAAAVAAGGGAGDVHTGPIRLTGLKLVSGAGPLRLSGVAVGGLTGQGGLPAAQAARVARAVPLIADQPAYLGAAQRALRRFRFAAPQWRAELVDGAAHLTLLAPAHVETDSGARLSLSTPVEGVVIAPAHMTGAATASIEGGGLPVLQVQVADASIAPSHIEADIAAKGALDLSPIRGARFDIKGRLTGGGARYRFDLTADAPLNAERLAFDPKAITGLSGVLGRDRAPLFEIGPQGWIATGHLQNVQGDIAGFDAGVRAADATFQAHGRKALDGLVLDLVRSDVLDQAKQARFMPLGFKGRVSLARGVLAGDLQASTRAGRAIGVIYLRHDLGSATGRVDIDASGLVFAPHALQPAELSPLADFAKDADGAASFRGWFGWGPGKTFLSGGELAAKALKFTSPVGPVLGIDSDIRFSSLAPLISAPDQVMTVRLVKAVTPLSGVSTQFDFTDKAVSIDAATGDVARGRIRLEPMVAPLTPGAQVKGALVLDHVNIGDIIAASTLADTVKMDAVIDGRIPFEYGPKGLTIQQGRLQAVGPGRVSISRKALTGAAGGGAALTANADAAAVQANFGQDIAYQAMENLAFDQLDASMDTQPGDRLGILFHIKGRHDPPQRARATIAVADLLRGQPLAKPINLPSDTKIDLTLDTSLNFGELVQALLQTWRDSTTVSVPALTAPVHSAPVQGLPPKVTPK